MTEELDYVIERAAIALAWVKRGPRSRLDERLTPDKHWRTHTPDAKAHYRELVQVVIAAANNAAVDPHA